MRNEESIGTDFVECISPINDWKDRLQFSRKAGVGFAAPGGEFTRAFAGWLASDSGAKVRGWLRGGTLIELGAGMYHYGYVIAALAGCRRYIGVEPFYADCLHASLQLFTERYQTETLPEYRVSSQDMRSFLCDTPDNSAHVLACGIEQCILPDFHYRQQVEVDIERVVGREHRFIASQSDLTPRLDVTQSATINPRTRKKRDLLLLYRKASSAQPVSSIR